MRYIEVERVDYTNNRYEYEQYAFPDSMEDEDIISDDLLMADFEDFIGERENPEYTEEELDNYRDNCCWYWYDIDFDGMGVGE